MSRSRPLVSAVLVVALGLGSLSYAFGDDKAQAVQLFTDTKKLMDAGNFTDACPKLESAKKLDPTADGVLLRLAACYEKVGKWASAWSHYSESLTRAEKAGNKDRIKVAKKGIVDTETKLTRVTVSVSATSKVAGLEVKWGDRVLDEGAWGSALPVDPGTYTLTASAPGHAPFSTTVTVGATAEKKAVDVPKLTPLPVAAPSSVPSIAPSASASVAAPMPSTTSGPVLADKPPSKAPAITALTTGSVLVLGGVATYVFGVRSARDDYFDTCAKQTTPSCENDAGKSKVRLLEGISYGAIGLGLVGVGAGIYLLATGRSGEEKRGVVVHVAPTVGGAGVVAIGRF